MRVDLPWWQDLKRHLLEIRAGIHDEKILKPCKAHSDEQIIERYKFLGGIQRNLMGFSRIWWDFVDI